MACRIRPKSVADSFMTGSPGARAEAALRSPRSVTVTYWKLLAPSTLGGGPAVAGAAYGARLPRRLRVADPESGPAAVPATALPGGDLGGMGGHRRRFQWTARTQLRAHSRKRHHSRAAAAIHWPRRHPPPSSSGCLRQGSLKGHQNTLHAARSDASLHLDGGDCLQLPAPRARALSTLCSLSPDILPPIMPSRIYSTLYS